ncbi:hypothetical protein BUALT_Bualt18G0022400 [Buddleja alternifolia]|uniref:Uncharacterized protein n=1 Tax=Buddleja alternifolia TaxID=168488 RepID=A0AAV6W3Z1_9LAMI|nr:hypothetical protein BUALT_Bualt18G0022400 [Buddleja alternifolia]
MGTISRLSRDIASANNYRIYVPFSVKDSTSTFIDCYTPSTNSWHRATSIPQYCQSLVLKDFSMVSIGHHIYIIGGRLCRKATEHDEAGVAQGTNPMVVPFVWRYNVRTNNWDTCSPMATSRSDFACTVSNNKIYVAGGKSTLGGAKGISSAEVYDPASDQWKSLAHMSTMRYKCVAVTWLGKVHIVGGFVDDGENQGPYLTSRSSAEAYDAEHDKWDFKARMWDLDVPPNQIISINGKLFSCGDCFIPWKGHIEAYDEQENIWNILCGSYYHCLSPTSTPEVTGPPMQRLYLTMAPIGNMLYFLTGYRISGNVSRLQSQVHVFDTAFNGTGWQSLDPIDEEGDKELCGHGCVLKYDS